MLRVVPFQDHEFTSCDGEILTVFVPHRVTKTQRPQVPRWRGEIVVGRKAEIFAIGRNDGHYMRVGRAVQWWYGFRQASELCAVWWLDVGYRRATNGLSVKPPWCVPRTYLKLFGWRLLSIGQVRGGRPRCV
jgi:hypothetical protein